MSRRMLVIGISVVVILLLVGAFVFVMHASKPIDVVRAYEVPDSLTIQASTPDPVAPPTADASIERTTAEIKAELRRELAEKNRLLEQNNRLLAEKDNELVAILQNRKLLEAENKRLKQEAELEAEYRASINWINTEWYALASKPVEESGFLVDWIDAGLNNEEYTHIFPDTADQQYLHGQFLELVTAREVLVEHLANASEPVRIRLIDALRQHSPDPASWDEFVEEVNQKVREG